MKRVRNIGGATHNWYNPHSRATVDTINKSSAVRVLEKTYIYRDRRETTTHSHLTIDTYIMHCNLSLSMAKCNVYQYARAPRTFCVDRRHHFRLIFIDRVTSKVYPTLIVSGRKSIFTFETRNDKSKWLDVINKCINEFLCVLIVGGFSLRSTHRNRICWKRNFRTKVEHIEFIWLTFVFSEPAGFVALLVVMPPMNLIQRTLQGTCTMESTTISQNGTKRSHAVMWLPPKCNHKIARNYCHFDQN